MTKPDKALEADDMRLMNTPQVLGLTLVTWLTLVGSAVAQADQDLFKMPREGVEAEHERFREIARTFEFTSGEDGRLPLRDESILNWSNPARNGEVGAIFIWEDAGRPAVIGTVFTYSAFNKSVRTKLAVHSLSSDPVRADLDRVTVWKPDQPGLAWQSVSDTPEKSGSPALRLTRLRSIAREFELTLSLPDKPPETLRLLPQPLYRYQSEAAGVVDGAVFGFVTATDPEALLFVEAVPDGGGILWRYAFARFHFAEIKATHAGAVVWKAELEFDQRNNRLGDPDFQNRIYSTMLIGEHFPAPPQ